jgi:aminoglycoside 6'-N-acetyltransferase I
MKIVDLTPDSKDAISQVTELLFSTFQNHINAWETRESAYQEVLDSLTPHKISRIATNETKQILGWISAFPLYGSVWEIHPLVIHPDYRLQKIGRSLLQNLEQSVKQKGGLTLWVGTDDDRNQTTLSNVNLYPNPWPHIANIQNLDNHPYGFYQKCGFSIVGVMPDANGRGKPDILMAKSIE